MTHALSLLVALASLAAPAWAAQPISNEIPICHNFNCGFTTTMILSGEEWEQITEFFRNPPQNAGEERAKIVRALGWFEVLAGRHSPIHLDLGQNRMRDGTTHGQMDCIDESLNTTTYLKALEQNGLMRFHQVMDRAYRRTAWDQHWAGRVLDTTTGRTWVIDSWFQDYGMDPFLQAYEQWMDIGFFFTSFVDNSPE